MLKCSSNIWNAGKPPAENVSSRSPRGHNTLPPAESLVHRCKWRHSLHCQGGLCDKSVNLKIIIEKTKANRGIQEATGRKHQARIFHEWLATAADMGVVPGVLGPSFDLAQDRRTLPRSGRAGLPAAGGTWTVLRRARRPAPLGPRLPRVVGIARWEAHLHGLVTTIH